MLRSKLSSKELLRDVLQPHTNLALDLMGLIKSFDTIDPTHRFEIASIIIFLAGVDKTLSLAFELLYLAGEVEWKWMSPNPRSKPPAGFIECQRGLTAKIMKLKDLGVDITYLQWLINLRNEYVHSCSIYAGYTLGLNEDTEMLRLEPSGPTLSFPLAPMTAIRSEKIQYYADQMIELIGSFIDCTEWQRGWSTITEKLEDIPKNPEPEYTQIVHEPENELEILNTLNEKLIGDGAKLILR
jgi:hypothetical protein